MRNFLIAFILLMVASPAWAETIVHDGDTFKLNGQNIRLWGIDAPELQQTCGDVPCGAMARDTLKAIIGSSDVICTPLGESYDRVVARCTVRNTDLGAAMIRIGMAFDYKPFSQGFYAAAQHNAKKSRVGVWGMADVQNPAQWRRGMTLSQFMSQFEPVLARMKVFKAAYDLPYKARIKARGVKAVNRVVNALLYEPDSQFNELLDPAVFWRTGGDCDKYALIKMLELRAQGVKDLYYLVLKNSETAHAVLVTKYLGQMVALDNRSDQLIPLPVLYREFQPVYMVDVKTQQVWRASGT